MKVRRIGRWLATAALAVPARGCAPAGTRAGDVPAAPGSAPASPTVVAEPTGPQGDGPPNHAG